MNKILSAVAKCIKGEGFKIDEKIPISYLLRFTCNMAFNYVRGVVKFRSVYPFVFIGKHADILCVSKITRHGLIKLGQGIYVDALSKRGVVLGKNFSLGRGSSIECTGSLKTLGHGFVSGDNVGIGSFCFFGCAGGINIGSDTIIGNYVSMHSENHNFGNGATLIRLQGVNHKGISIGQNCWIGAKATILDGATIGNNTVIAAGSVVRSGIYPENVVLGGIPAKVIKVME